MFRLASIGFSYFLTTPFEPQKREKRNEKKIIIS